jgi:hypothetical protein
VLATFTYSKETYPQDRIYASLVLVKCVGLQQLIVPDYKKTAEEVFYDTAAYVINELQDFYLWGTKSLLSKRTVRGLPSWVPEWTGTACENVVEYFNLDFGHCVIGRPLISGCSLYVNAHITAQ